MQVKFLTGLAGDKTRTGYPVKADLRREITAWKALVWAYRDECVAAATNTEADRYDYVGFAQARTDRERSGGLIHGRLDAHADAVMIDAKARAWFGGNGMWLVTVIRAAERAEPPARVLQLVEARPAPMYNRDGSLAVQLRKSNGKWQPVYCLVDWVGEPAEVLAARRRDWQTFLDVFDAFLAAMAGFPLTKWRVLTQ